MVIERETKQNFVVRNTRSDKWSTNIQWNKMPVSYLRIILLMSTLIEVLTLLNERVNSVISRIDKLVGIWLLLTPHAMDISSTLYLPRCVHLTLNFWMASFKFKL